MNGLQFPPTRIRIGIRRIQDAGRQNQCIPLLDTRQWLALQSRQTRRSAFLLINDVFPCRVKRRAYKLACNPSSYVRVVDSSRESALVQQIQVNVQALLGPKKTQASTPDVDVAAVRLGVAAQRSCEIEHS